MSPDRVLVVCTANICRSPVAAALLEDGLTGTGIRVHSAGTRAVTGSRPTPEAVEYVRARTGSAPTSLGTPLIPAQVLAAGLVLTMTEHQRGEVVDLVPSALRRVFTLRQFVRLAPLLPAGDEYAGLGPLADAVAACRPLAPRPPAGADDVPDPYGGPPSRYARSFALIEDAAHDTARVLRARCLPRAGSGRHRPT